MGTECPPWPPIPGGTHRKGWQPHGDLTPNPTSAGIQLCESPRGEVAPAPGEGLKGKIMRRGKKKKEEKEERKD